MHGCYHRTNSSGVDIADCPGNTDRHLDREEVQMSGKAEGLAITGSLAFIFLSR